MTLSQAAGRRFCVLTRAINGCLQRSYEKNLRAGQRLCSNLKRKAHFATQVLPPLPGGRPRKAAASHAWSSPFRCPRSRAECAPGNSAPHRPRRSVGSCVGCILLMRKSETPMRSEAGPSRSSNPTARKGELLRGNRMLREAKAGRRKARGNHNPPDRAIPNPKGC